MLSDILKKQMIDFVLRIGHDEEIEKFYDRHKDSHHVLPLVSRIQSSIMYSINSRLGYLVEDILREIITSSQQYSLHNVSGIHKTPYTYSEQSKILIEQYITTKRSSRIICDLDDYDQLLQGIDEYEYHSSGNIITENYNVDLLFRTGDIEGHDLDEYYLVEIKYADTHNMYQRMNIYRKLFCIYAGLHHILPDSYIYPTIYYFDSYRVRNSQHIPSEYVFKSQEFFQKFQLPISYSDIMSLLKETRESSEMKEVIDHLQQKISRCISKKI